jgi:hypothetical protein
MTDTKDPPYSTNGVFQEKSFWRRASKPDKVLSFRKAGLGLPFLAVVTGGTL